jgi:hypothetical protein
VDGGGFYTPGQRATVIHHNVITGTSDASNRASDAISLIGLDSTGLLSDIYLDNVSSGCVVRNNGPTGSTAHFVLAAHYDILHPPPGQVTQYIGGQAYNILTAPAGKNLVANLSPSAQEDPVTAGGAITRYEAETLTTSHSSNISILGDAAASPPPGSLDANKYVLFHPPGTSDVQRSITFTIPNPEYGGSGAWYNLRIGMIRNSNYGKYRITLGGNPPAFPLTHLTDYQSKAIIIVDEAYDAPNPKHDYAVQLIDYQNRWHLKPTDHMVYVTLTAVLNSSNVAQDLSIDYFEFGRSADQD